MVHAVSGREGATPAGLSPEEKLAFLKRRRGRNIALLVVLVGLVALFYLITLAKIASSEG